MLKDVRPILAPDLADRDFQQEYLTALYQEAGVGGVLEGLREIALATGKMDEVAQSVAVSPTSLSRALSSGGDPGFRTVEAVLTALGLGIAFVPLSRSSA